MKLQSPHSDIFVADDSPLPTALARTTHLGIGAHPDDLEIIAWQGIAHCYDKPTAWFTGLVLSDGAGSPRAGAYADYSNAAMVEQRCREQRNAARLGKYSVQLQLGATSEALQAPEGAGAVAGIVEDIVAILRACQPEVVYLHNLADAHATHVACARHALNALRRLPAAELPQAVWGVEAWRSLDWLPEEYRTVLPLPADASLQVALLQQHDSQINGGKRYDLAVIARQTANATLACSHGVDIHPAAALAMDLMPLLRDPAPGSTAYLEQIMDAFRAGVLRQQ